MQKTNLSCSDVPQLIYLLIIFTYILLMTERQNRKKDIYEICRYYKGGSACQQEEGLAYYTGRSE